MSVDYSMRSRPSQRGGFTLLELLIVCGILTVLLGIAISNFREMYDKSEQRSVVDETKSIGTSLSYAYNDLGFYPKLNLLSMTKELLVDNDKVFPGVDIYGYYGTTGPILNKMLSWKGAYLAINSQGIGTSAKTVLVELSDVALNGVSSWPGWKEPLNVVEWPADPWGSPYVFYCVTVEPSLVDDNTNPLGLRPVIKPDEPGKYFTACVSYGPNKMPGGTEKTPANIVDNRLMNAALFSPIANAQDHEPKFKMRAYGTSGGSSSLYGTPFWREFGRSVKNPKSTPDGVGLADTPGIMDIGSDDLLWQF